VFVQSNAEGKNMWLIFVFFALLGCASQASHGPGKYVQPVRANEVIGFDFTQDLYDFFNVKKPEKPNEIAAFKRSLVAMFLHEFKRYNAANFKDIPLAKKGLESVKNYIRNGFKILYAQKARQKYKPTADKGYVINFDVDAEATPEEQSEIVKIISLAKDEASAPTETKKEMPAVVLSPEQQKELQKNLDLLGQSLFVLNQQLPQAAQDVTRPVTRPKTPDQLQADLAAELARRRSRIEEDDED
jgi:hypothetical protein